MRTQASVLTRFRRLAFASIAAWLVLAAPKAYAQEPTESWPAGVQKKPELPGERAYSYEAEGVDLKTIVEWLEWFRIELPLELEGKVDAWIWVQRGATWSELSNYRVEAEIRSPQLMIQGLRVEQAEIRFGYFEGTWHLSNLSGYLQLENGASPFARLRLLGTANESSSNKLKVLGTAELLDLQQLANRFGWSQLLTARSSADGETKRHLSFRADAPLGDLSDLTGWKVDAQLQVPQLPLGLTNLVTLNGSLHVEDGSWQLLQSYLDFDGVTQGGMPVRQRVLLAGSGTLTGEQDFQLKVPEKVLDLAALSIALPEKLKFLQRLGLSVRAKGSKFGIQEIRAEARASEASEPVASLKFDFQPQKGAELAANFNFGDDVKVQCLTQWNSLAELVAVPKMVQLELADCNLSRIASFAAVQKVGIAGQVSGKVKIQTQPQDKDEASATFKWACDGDLRLHDLGFASEGVASFALGSYRFKLSKTFDAESVHGEIEDSRRALGGRASLRCEPLLTIASLAEVGGLVQDLNASVDARGFRLSVTPNAARRTATPIAALLDGQFRIQGGKANWLRQADLELTRLHLDLPEPITLVNCRGQASEAELRLMRFELKDASGSVAGAASFSRDGKSDHRINLSVKGLSLGRDLSDWGVPKFIGGLAAAELRLRKSPNESNWIDGWNGGVALGVQNFRFRGQTLGSFGMKGSFRGGDLSLKGDGRLLGGPANLRFYRTHAKAAGNVRAKQGIPSFEHELICSVEGLQLSGLVATVGNRVMASRIGGTGDLELDLTIAPDQLVKAETTLGLKKLSVDQNEVVEKATLVGSYADSGKLVLRKLTGRVLGGTIVADGSWQFLDSQREGLSVPVGKMHYQWQRFDMQRLLAIFLPGQEVFGGAVTASGDVRFDRQISVTSTIHSGEGVLIGLAVQELDGNVRASFDSAGGLMRLDANNIHGRIAKGRATADFKMKNNAGHLGFDTEIKISHGSLRQLDKSLGFDHIAGEGQFGARVKLGSSDIAELDKLTGTFACDFSGAKSNSVPVLKQLNRLVPGVELLDTTINSGEVSGRLNGDQVRIEDIFLSSNAFFVVGAGRADLGTSYFDLDLLLQTGGGLADQLVQNGIQYGAAELLADSVVLFEIADLLRNHSLVFRVKGTANHSSIQFRAAESIAKSFIQQVRRQLMQDVTPLSANRGK